MWLMPRDVSKEEKGSEENGGPLSEKKVCGSAKLQEKVL